MPTPNLLLDHIVQSQAQKEVTANETFDGLEQAITEEAELDVAGAANVTLTDAQMRNAILRLTGILTGSIEVIVPNRDKQYQVHNATTGDFTLTVKTAAGTGVVVEQGFKAHLYCDGTNVLEWSGTAQRPYRTLTGSVTLRPTDEVLYCDATAGNVTVTLPAASACLGRRFLFIRVDSSANTVTIQRAGADDLNNGATSAAIANTIGTGLLVTGYSASRFLAQTLTAA